MCAASVSNEGFWSNLSRNNDVHRLPRQGFHCTTKASYEAKKIPGCTNLTWFCWIMLNLVPVTPHFFIGRRGTKPGILIRLSHRVYISGYTFLRGNTYLIFRYYLDFFIFFQVILQRTDNLTWWSIYTKTPHLNPWTLDFLLLKKIKTKHLPQAESFKQDRMMFPPGAHSLQVMTWIQSQHKCWQTKEIEGFSEAIQTTCNAAWHNTGKWKHTLDL